MGAVREAIYWRVRFALLLGLFFAPVAALAWHQHLLAYDLVLFDNSPNPAMSELADEDYSDDSDPADCRSADIDPSNSADPICLD